MRGAGDRLPPSALPVDASLLCIDDAIARARATGHSGAVAQVELQTLLGRATYVVSFTDEATVMVDAHDGATRPRLVEAEAAEVARAAYRGGARVERLDLVSSEHDAADLPVPVYRVRLADPRATEVFISPATGKILAWRNRHWRWFDRLWSLHVLGYINRDNPAHAAMRVVGTLALLAVVSGALLLVATRRRNG